MLRVAFVVGLVGVTSISQAQPDGLRVFLGHCDDVQITAVSDELAAARPLDEARFSTSTTARRQAEQEELDRRYLMARSLYALALRMDLARVPPATESEIATDLLGLVKIALWRTYLGTGKALLECSIALSAGIDTSETAYAFALQANLQMAVGHWDDAEASLARAMPTLRAAGDPGAGYLAYALATKGNLRVAYHPPSRTGPDEEPEVLYAAALAAYDRDPGCMVPCLARAVTMTSLADAIRGLTGFDDATRMAQQALAIKLAMVDPGNDSIATSFQTLAHIAVRRGRQGDTDIASENFRRALGILLSFEKARPGDATAVQSRIAEVSEDAAGFFERSDSPEGRSEAIILYTLSVEARQRMRNAASTLPENYARDLTHAIEGPYHRLANLLIDQGRLAEAQQVLALLKNEELNVLVRGGGTSATSSVVSGTHRQAGDYVARLTAPEWLSLISDLTKLEAEDPSTVDRPRLEKLRRQATAQRVEVQKLVARLTPKPSSSLWNWVRDQSSRLGQATKTDPKTIGVQYVVEDGRLGIILVRGDYLLGRTYKIDATKLSRQVNAFILGLQNQDDVRAVSGELWQLLIEPILPYVQEPSANGLVIDTLAISTTGVLRYLPFAALKGPSNDAAYLVKEYAVIAWADAASGDAAAKRRPWKIRAMGLRPNWTTLPAIPDVETELESIVRRSGSSSGLIPGDAPLYEDFDKRKFEEALKGSANIVHVASHFQFVPGYEDKSLLYLSKKGETLSITDLSNLDFKNVDLLVLSACETAKGGGYQNGFEVEGLAATVMRKNGRTVLASLWKINDGSTAEFMKRFYSKLAADPSVNLAQALRATQLEFIQDASKDGPLTNWSQPRFWAPFVMSGSWLRSES